MYAAALTRRDSDHDQVDFFRASLLTKGRASSRVRGVLRSRSPLRASYWLAVAWLMLLVPAWEWFVRRPELLSIPDTPISHVNADYAEQWRFLWEARHAVLPGRSYTVRASDRDTEMSLYMMSLGLCTKRTPMPTSYFRGNWSHVGQKAHFVLAYRGFTGNEQGLRFVVRVRNGVVYERPAAQ